MTWPNGTRYKNAAPGGSWTPADMNGAQDQVLQVAGYRGKTIIATAETRTNLAYGLLTTPDEVAGIVLPADGLLCVDYQALWRSVVGGGGNVMKAALFIGANQLKIRSTAAAPVVQEASVDGALTGFTTLSTGPEGLVSPVPSVGSATDVATGQVDDNGGVTVIRGLPAGTYTVSVQFSNVKGVEVKSRALRVWTEAFA